MNYFDLVHAIREHDFIINNTGGGLMGIKDKGHLEMILQMVRNDDYYPLFEDKVCYLFYSLNKGHTFSDGNKRTSIVLSSYFMEINGFELKIDYFIKEMDNIAVHVADNIIDKDLLYEIVVSILYDVDYSEELKIKIMNAIQLKIEETVEQNKF